MDKTPGPIHLVHVVHSVHNPLPYPRSSTQIVLSLGSKTSSMTAST